MKVIGVHIENESQSEIARAKRDLAARISAEGLAGKPFTTKLIRAWDVVEKKRVLRVDAFIEDSAS